MPTLDDERFEAYLKRFRPLVPEPLPAVEPSLRARRAVALGVAPDEGGEGANAHPRYVTTSTVVSATWRLADGVALHAIAEADHDAIHDLQLRAIGMFDFAFAPEP